MVNVKDISARSVRDLTDLRVEDNWKEVKGVMNGGEDIKPEIMGVLEESADYQRHRMSLPESVLP